MAKLASRGHYIHTTVARVKPEPIIDEADNGNPHYHQDETGTLRKCYHKCKSTLTDFSFWLGVTLSFPLEHFIWEKVPGFSHVGKLLEL